MSVIAVRDQSITLDVGDVWKIGVLTLDDDEYPTTATVTAVVTDPEGATSSSTVMTDATGYYYAEYAVVVPGRHLAALSASDGVVGTVPFTAWAQDPTAGDGTPTFEQVKAYLGDVSWSDDEILDAYLAETAAQRSRCRIPPIFPYDLAQALKRRVARNLAARAVPVATFTTFEGGGTSTRVPMLDAEIARFEGPFRKRKVG